MNSNNRDIKAVNMDDSLTPHTLPSSGNQVITSAMPVPQTDQPSFPILKLPLEIRNLIYGFALTSSPLRTHRYHHWIKVAMGFEPYYSKNRARPSLNLLLANHQIYNEAAHILYHEGCFIIPSAMVPRAGTGRFYFFEPSEDVLSPPDLTALNEKWYSNIRNIEIEIGYYAKFDFSKVLHGGFNHVEQFLARFPYLKTITVAWQYYTDPMEDSSPRNPKAFVKWRRSDVIRMLDVFESIEMSHPAVKVTVQDTAEGWPFEEQVGRRGIDRSVQEFIAAVECEVPQECWW